MKNNNVNNDEVVIIEGQEMLEGTKVEEIKEVKEVKEETSTKTGKKGKGSSTKGKTKKETDVFSARLPVEQKKALGEIFSSMDSEDFGNMVIRAHRITLGADKTDLFAEDSIRLQNSLETILEVFQHGNATHKALIEKVEVQDQAQETIFKKFTDRIAELETENAELRSNLLEEAKQTEQIQALQEQVAILTEQLKTRNTLEDTLKMIQDQLKK